MPVDVKKSINLRGEEAGTFWQGILDRTRRYRNQHVNGDKAWLRYTRLYRGQHWRHGRIDDWDPDSDQPRERITVNQTLSIILNTVPFLVKRRPKFLLTPRRPQDIQSVTLQQELLNYVWGEFDMQKQLRRAVLDSTVIGHGILKTGFTLEIDESINPQVEGDQEYRQYIRKEQPFIQRVSPFRFYFDPEAPEHDLDSAAWAIEIIFKPLRDVLLNKRYDRQTRMMIRRGMVEPTRATSYLRTVTESGFQLDDQLIADDDPALDRLVLFEVWDKRAGKYYVFAHGVPRPLIERNEWPYPYLEGFPYTMLPYIPVIDDPYPLGIPATIEDQQLELNRNRTMQFQHRRRFNRKYVLNQRAFDDPEDNAIKLTNGGDGTVLIAKDEAAGAVHVVEDAQLPVDSLRVEDIIKGDLREITGADELIRGGQLPSRTSATEINSRERLFGLKLDDRVSQVDDAVHRVGRQVLQHMKANFVQDQVLRIAGPRGVHWKTFTVEDIQAEYDMTIESTSAQRQNEDTIRQQKLQVFQHVMQSLPLFQALGQTPAIDPTALLKWVLESFNDTQDIGRFFSSILQDAPPLQEQPAAAPPPGQAATQRGVQAPTGQRPEDTGAAAAGENGLTRLLGQLGG